MSTSQPKYQSTAWSRTVVFKYGVSVVSVAGAALLTLLLSSFLDTIPLFYAAVIVSSWYGGRGPGFLAVLLATGTVNYMIVPPSGFNFSVTDLVQMGAFAILAVVISLLSTARRNAELALRQTRDEMEAKVI